MGRNRCSQHGMKINRLFFTQDFAGQEIDLKKYSKLYWQPMKTKKQWNTASKWRRLCHQSGQLILYTLKRCEVNVSNDICEQKVKFLSNITPTLLADLAGLVLTPRSSIGHIIIIHHYVPSVVNRSAVMDLYGS